MAYYVFDGTGAEMSLTGTQPVTASGAHWFIIHNDTNSTIKGDAIISHPAGSASLHGITDATNAVITFQNNAARDALNIQVGDVITVTGITGTNASVYNTTYPVTAVPSGGSTVTTSRDTSAASANAAAGGSGALAVRERARYDFVLDGEDSVVDTRNTADGNLTLDFVTTHRTSAVRGRRVYFNVV